MPVELCSRDMLYGNAPTNGSFLCISDLKNTDMNRTELYMQQWTRCMKNGRPSAGSLFNNYMLHECSLHATGCMDVRVHITISALQRMGWIGYAALAVRHWLPAGQVHWLLEVRPATLQMALVRALLIDFSFSTCGHVIIVA